MFNSECGVWQPVKAKAVERQTTNRAIRRMTCSKFLRGLGISIVNYDISGLCFGKQSEILFWIVTGMLAQNRKAVGLAKMGRQRVPSVNGSERPDSSFNRRAHRAARGGR